MKKYRIRICGRKTSTPPTPATTPSTSRLCSGPSATRLATCWPVHSVAPSINPIGHLAQLNTAWNMSSMVSASMTSPNTGCSASRSNRSDQSHWRWGSRTARSRISRIVCLFARISSIAGGCQGRLLVAPDKGEAWSSSSSSCCAPPFLTPTVLTTGMPRAVDKACVSMVMPCARAMSLMLSASTMGTPRRCACSTSCKFKANRVASTTHTSNSGGGSLPLPVMMSRVSAWSLALALRL